MLEVGKDLTITISQGDILDITFKISGLILAENSEVYLAVKKSLSDKTPYLFEQCDYIDRATSSVRIVIESAEMQRLPPGKYYYDIVYKVGENRRTLNYPARFIVWEVVHDGWI